MLDTVCGTPCCMLKYSQSGSVRNTVLQSNGHMLTSTWCSSYYTRKCLQDAPLDGCGQVRGCSHFFGQIRCSHIRNVPVFFPLCSAFTLPKHWKWRQTILLEISHGRELMAGQLKGFDRLYFSICSLPAPVTLHAFHTLHSLRRLCW